VLNLTHTSSKGRPAEPTAHRASAKFGLEAAIKFENLDAFGRVGQTASSAVLAPPSNEASRQMQLSADEMRLGRATLYSLVAARFSSCIRFFDEHDVFELRRLMSNVRRK
jgi:hypothetical protein